VPSAKKWKVPDGYRVRRCRACTIGPIVATKQGEPIDIQILDSEEVPPNRYVVPCPVCGRINLVPKEVKKLIS
jgi:hypothetical protein